MAAGNFAGMNLHRAALAAALIACSMTASAWNASGHMVIAAIAERNLRPEVRLEAERLLKIGATPRASDFITAGPWADDVRSQRQESGPWHYINLHFRIDGKPVKMKPDPENVVAAIARFSAILRDRSKSDEERADALRYLIHFVGDIHQPLHTTALDTDEWPEGDRGGNSFRIQPPLMLSRESRPPTNLHSLWDSGVGLFPEVDRPLARPDRKLVETQAITLMAAIPKPARPSATDVNPAAWASEGLQAAKSTVYTLKPNDMPSKSYVEAGQALSARRAATAGYRLALLLNTLLESPR